MNYALLELRGNTFIADHISQVKVRDGFLEIMGLPAGNYELMLKETGEKIALRITDGLESAGFLISGRRQLEENNPATLQIVSIEQNDESVVVQLANQSAYARVHAIATRYVPPFDLFEDLNVVHSPHSIYRAIKPPHTHYIAMRDIGDEYRYVLERKYAEKFSGNMLSRPELLLNPWSVRGTETDVAQAKAGEAHRSVSDMADSMPLTASAQEPAESERVSYWNFDFIKDESVVLANLKPEANGRVIIDRKQLGANQQLYLIAVDPLHTVYHQVDLNNSELRRRDLRLARSFDGEKHFNEQKK